jgi:Protein of unknown function
MMDRDKAAEIREHLVDAVRAMDRAEAAIRDLDEETRIPFAEPLAKASDLHFELLQMIHDRCPDLPNGEIPTITSTLRWEDVHISPSVTEADLDGVIFSCLQPQWRKMAAIVGRAGRRCEELSLPVEAEVLGARIQALADAGRIERQGDLRYWRHSEVRLKP